jgi:hypothetical protein
VHQHGANPIAAKRRHRLFDRIWLMFHRLSDDEPVETDPAQNDAKK